MKLYTFEKIAGIQPSKGYLRNPKYQFEKIAAGATSYAPKLNKSSNKSNPINMLPSNPQQPSITFGAGGGKWEGTLYPESPAAMAYRQRLDNRAQSQTIANARANLTARPTAQPVARKPNITGFEDLPQSSMKDKAFAYMDTLDQQGGPTSRGIRTPGFGNNNSFPPMYRPYVQPWQQQAPPLPQPPAPQSNAQVLSGSKVPWIADKYNEQLGKEQQDANADRLRFGGGNQPVQHTPEEAQRIADRRKGTASVDAVNSYNAWQAAGGATPQQVRDFKYSELPEDDPRRKAFESAMRRERQIQQGRGYNMDQTGREKFIEDTVRNNLVNSYNNANKIYNEHPERWAQINSNYYNQGSLVPQTPHLASPETPQESNKQSILYSNPEDNLGMKWTRVVSNKTSPSYDLTPKQVNQALGIGKNVIPWNKEQGSYDLQGKTGQEALDLLQKEEARLTDAFENRMGESAQRRFAGAYGRRIAGIENARNSIKNSKITPLSTSSSSSKSIASSEPTPVSSPTSNVEPDIYI